MPIRSSRRLGDGEGAGIFYGVVAADYKVTAFPQAGEKAQAQA